MSIIPFYSDPNRLSRVFDDVFYMAVMVMFKEVQCKMRLHEVSYGDRCCSCLLLAFSLVHRVCISCISAFLQASPAAVETKLLLHTSVPSWLPEPRAASCPRLVASSLTAALFFGQDFGFGVCFPAFGQHKNSWMGQGAGGHSSVHGGLGGCKSLWHYTSQE